MCLLVVRVPVLTKLVRKAMKIRYHCVCVCACLCVCSMYAVVCIGYMFNELCMRVHVCVIHVVSKRICDVYYMFTLSDHFREM